MDTAIIATIIGIFGAAAFGAFGFILTGLRADIQANGERIQANGERLGRLEKGFGRFEERTISEFGQVKDVLARIEATREDHSRLLQNHDRLLEAHSHQLADHGRLLEKLAGDGAP